MKLNRITILSATWTFCYLFCSVTSVTGFSSAIASREKQYVIENQVAVISWIITKGDSTNQIVKCTAKTKTFQDLAIGEFEIQNLSLDEIQIPINTLTEFNHRLKAKPYLNSDKKVVFELTIESSVMKDSGFYECRIGGEIASTYLQIYQPLVEQRLIPKSIILQTGKEILRTELCGKPKPKVTMIFQGKTQKVKGVRTNIDGCYMFTLKNVTSFTEQKFCGKTVDLIYEGAVQTLRRSVSLQMGLKPKPPENVIISLMSQDNCAHVRWDGPNIGSCIVASLSYQVEVFENEAVVKRMDTSSNVIETCGIDFLRKRYTLKVRNVLNSNYSSWSVGRVVLEETIFDGVFTALIACAAVAVFLLIILITYCMCTRKERLKAMCKSKKFRVRHKNSAGKSDEERPLNDMNGSVDGGVHLQETGVTNGQIKQENKRKISRKISSNDMNGSAGENGNTANGGGRKNSQVHPTGGEQKQKKNDKGSKAKLHPNNQDRKFYSLQRNIEREKKKLEEMDFEQQEDEFYAERRNTDSHILQDLRNTFCEHRLEPRSSNEASTPYSSIATDDEPRHTGSPLYDVLPNTRSSASTNSTGGGRSFHEEDDPLARRRYTTDSAFSSETDPTTLYDVLPRTNTNAMLERPIPPRSSFIKPTSPLPPQPSQTFESASQAYDFLPPARSADAALDHQYQVPPEKIYDVPRPAGYKDTTDHQSQQTTGAMPFSSHRAPHAIQT
uniref:Ig-like domain-containing protein n=1 Tax=Clytia hemisphaerica TaxID=252671 RepID=A0A7M5XEM4_9CNID